MAHSQRSYGASYAHKLLPSVWMVAAEDEARTRANSVDEQRRVADEIQKRRDEIKRHSLNG